MRAGSHSARTLSEAVDLVNVFGAGEAGHATEEQLRGILRSHTLPPRPLDLEGFAGLAGSLRAVFEAPDDAGRIRVLNALLEAYRPDPRLTAHDGEDPHFHVAPADGPALPAVGATLAMALATFLVDAGGSRFGCCAAPDCHNVFLDTTRSGGQRSCSRRCAARIRGAEHRAEH